MAKIGRNHPCHCGNGKKYKNCHLILEEQKESAQRNWASWTKKIQPFARISSSGSEPSSFTIERKATIEDGIQTVHLDKEVTLSVNTIKEEGSIEERDSMALITFPKGKRETGEIVVKGNASISNDSKPCAIDILCNDKIESTGLFAKIRKKHQRSGNYDFFDILFGANGNQESTNPETGEKDRPHIAFYPDGNGKYVRLSGYKCTLEGNMT